MSTNDTIDTTAPTEGDEPTRVVIAPHGLTRYDHESDEAWEFRVEHTRDERAERAQALRELAELVESRDLAMPEVILWSFSSSVRATWDASDEQMFTMLRRVIGSTIDSPWVKDSSNGLLRVERELIPRLTVVVRASWGTCKKVEVGRKTVERYVDVCPACGEGELTDVEDSSDRRCADDDCAFVIRAPKRVAREVEEPIEEWRCPELADLAGDER